MKLLLNQRNNDQLIYLQDVTSRRVRSVMSNFFDEEHKEYNCNVEDDIRIIPFANHVRELLSEFEYLDPDALKIIDDATYKPTGKKKIAKEIKMSKILDGKVITEYNNISELFQDIRNTLDPVLFYTLTDLQWHDVLFGVSQGSYANFSVPGTGKTVTTLATFMYWYIKGETSKMVVFGPSSSFDIWIEEWEKMFIAGKTVENKNWIFTESSRGDRKKFMQTDRLDWNQLLLHYQSTINDHSMDALESGFKIKENITLVIDEAHYAKNVDGKWGGNIQKLSEHAKYKVILTGTPLPNGPSDIVNYYAIIFDRRYATQITQAISSYKGEKFEIATQTEYKKYFESLYIRRTKEDLKLPDLTQNTHSIQLDDIQRKAIDEIFIKIKNPLAKIIRVIQALSNPLLLMNLIELDDTWGTGDDVKELDSSGTISLEVPEGYIPPKFAKINEILNKVNGRVLIWSNFKQNHRELSALIKERNTYIYNGDIKKHSDRKDILDSFRDDPTGVLIANPQTLAESVSLHKECHHAIYLDLSYNYTHFEQSKNRIHRFGLSSDQKTTVDIIVTNDNSAPLLDEKLVGLLAEKELFQETALNERNIVDMDANVNDEDIKKDLLFILEN